MSNSSLPKPDSKGAFRRMMMVLSAFVAILIYAYGWNVTEINLDRPQEETRQENVTRALRELLSPRIFSQERQVVTYEAQFLVGCDTGTAPAQADITSGQPVIVLEPACGSATDPIVVHIYNAEPGADARLRWQPPANDGEEVNERPREILELEREDFVIDSSGGFRGTIEVPRIRASEGQTHIVRALVAVPSGPIVLSDTANLVIEKMAQTIFMALVATLVAIPVSALISFFAAHNLMKPIRLSFGSMLLTFIMLNVGFVIGSSSLTELGNLGIRIGHGAELAPFTIFAFIIPAVVLVAVVMVLRRLAPPAQMKRDYAPNLATQTLSSVIVAIATIFLVGALAGLGILGGEQFTLLGNAVRPQAVTDNLSWLQNASADLIWSVGNLLDILGRLVQLFMSSIAGLVTGFAFVSITGALVAPILRRTTGIVSTITAGIFGMIGGAILMSWMTALGLWAALLGVLPPLIGGIMAGSVLVTAYDRFINDRPHHEQSNMHRTARNVLFMIGLAGMFLIVFNALNIGRSMVDGTLPPQTAAVVFGMPLGLTQYMFTAMLVGGILGGIGGLLSGLQSPFPLGDYLYNTARTSLNIVRSIEPLIMGLVFVVWVGIGPFAGVLALMLHSIASLGKLYSEQIENIDQGPIEALQSTGANQLQTIVYAVVPQIIPPYIAFTMYRWDINVRMSTIIGFVGGGGIGLLLQQQINLLRYRDAGVAVLAIAVVVSILDYASANIRERLN